MLQGDRRLALVSGFTEVGDRVWVARYEWYDVNVTVIEGEAGLLVVDTHASARAAREVIADLRRLSSRPVTGIVNTHDHVDHVFGNGAFRAEYGAIPITATDSTAETTVPHGEQVKASLLASGRDRAREIAETAIVPADHMFSSVTAIDLGDRSVELVHPGRGHTAGDLVVRIDDADIVLAGDLVEESGLPAYGDDCFPMEWPRSLDLALQLIGPGTVVVPGHGARVDRDFVQEQRSSIGVVAETIRDLAGRGVPLGHALDAASWPYPSENLGHAVRRGYEQLPRDAKRLPLL
ncbi:MAG: beta-lactamase domain protein [Marmoricola sp.]|nr:beta-lactamase domain protein [Marmoricola sp.]